LIALRGQIGLDYGACSHAASPYDGQVRFEHDGCDAYNEREDGTFGKPPRGHDETSRRTYHGSSDSDP
jgi:hypothetical protein